MTDPVEDEKQIAPPKVLFPLRNVIFFITTLSAVTLNIPDFLFA